MYVLAGIIGFFAIIAWSLSIQNKDRENILIYQIAANAFYSIQYFLLGAVTAGLTNLLSIFRCLTFYFEEKIRGKISLISFIIFSLLILLIGVITYESLISLIPVLCGILYIYSIWQKNLNLTRYIFIFAAVLLTYYNFKVGAIVLFFGNITDILSGIISIIRFRSK